MIIKKFLLALLSLVIVAELGLLAYLLLGMPSIKKERAEPKPTIVTPSKSSRETTTITSSTMETDIDKETQRPPLSEWLSSETEIRFPILMYHSLSEGNSLKIPPTEFRQHLEYLAAAGYYTLTPEEAYLVLTENKKPAEKIVWLTFDDGYLNNYTEGFPLLQEFKMDATINYIIAKEGNENYFNLTQMKEMRDSGLISIQSHTVNHLEVNVMDEAQQQGEFGESKKYLDEQLGQNTTVLCYPAGRYAESNFDVAAETGYKLALTTEPGYASASDGLFALKRVRVSPGYDHEGFGNLIKSFE